VRFAPLVDHSEADWRAVVDVDIPNERDGKEKYYSPSVILRCNNDL